MADERSELLTLERGTAIKSFARVPIPDGIESEIHRVLYKVSEQFGNRPVLSIFEAGKLRQITYTELREKARNLASQLTEFGVVAGDRIALFCDSSPEWGITFFACVRCGVTLVPLDTKSSQAELKVILEDVQPKLILTSDARLAELRSFSEAFALVSLDHIEKSYREYELPQHRDPSDDALIIYTSGTTGNPKGVRITYRNLLTQVQDVKLTMGVRSEDVFLSILPLNHLFELTCGFLSPLFHGAEVCYANSLIPAEIIRYLRARRASWMVTVPMFLRLLKTGIETELRKKTKFQQFMFRALFSCAAILPLELRRRAFKPIHENFGGRLKNLICGGAPPSNDVAVFFERLGFCIYQGYGLTETSPIISANMPGQSKRGTVGKPYPSVQVKILNGEILTRGPHVTPGYYKRPDLTRTAIDDEGWFHTGDLGYVDRDGFLRITGRIKEMIVLAGGKKVFPDDVETVLRRSSLVKDLCVLGTRWKEGLLAGTEQVTVVVVPTDSLRAATGDKHQEMIDELERDFVRLGRDLSAYKRPTRIEIRFEDFPRTSTRKIKLGVLNQWLEEQQD
jgi:long-chain acyl-CoA synthetase